MIICLLALGIFLSGVGFGIFLGKDLEQSRRERLLK